MTSHLVYADSAYRNASLYPNSNSYTLFLTNPIRNVSRVELVSAFINTSGLSNTYVFLDVAELRTPFHQDARKMSNQASVSGNTAVYSFAQIPLDVTPGSIKVFKESADYKVEAEYPSRIDRLSQLTVNWVNNQGQTVSGLNDTTGTGFILRVFTKNVKIEKSILNDLPPPVPWDAGPNVHLAAALLGAGLLAILFVRT
jgi:hypothetical protein